MNFSKVIQRKNKLLLPFSWLYSVGVAAHNLMYDWGWRRSYEPALPVICVGNLSVGGTGKTPMVEYLLRLLSRDFKVATISRGYKRETRGVYIAGDTTTAGEIGDEPMQFHSKFPNALVMAAEKRAEAIEELLQKHPEVDVVILDDAFQHRAVRAGLNIILTAYNNLFIDDYYLPAGQLRDLKSSYRRANMIIVTKSPGDLSQAAAKKIISRIKPLPHQTVFFTSVSYGTPYQVFGGGEKELKHIKHATLITGIANPRPLMDYLKRHDIGLNSMSFPDHHRFSQNDIETIKQTFQKNKEENKIVITTEKDAMRLHEFERSLKDLPLYAVPIAHYFLFNEGLKFDGFIHQFIQAKK